MSTWKELKEAGWEFVRYDEKKRRNVYRSPPRKGKRKTIFDKKDLLPEDLLFAKILFEDGARQIREEALQEEGKEQEVEVEVEQEVEVLLELEQDEEQQELVQGEDHQELGQGEDQQELVQGEDRQDLGQGEESQDKGVFEHNHALEASARKVEKMVREFGSAVINIDKSVEDLTFALSSKPHPFKDIPDGESNFFAEVIDFGLTYNVDLLYSTARHKFTLESLSFMDSSKVIQLATAYTNIVCGFNPKQNNGFKKWVSVLVQSCGLNNVCLDVMATLGFTETSR